MRTTVKTNGTLLKALLRDRGWHRYDNFVRAYYTAAATVGEDGYPPAARTLRRWQQGIEEQPHSYHCRVLAAMFPGYTIEALFAPFDLLADAPIPAPVAAATPPLSLAERCQLMRWTVAAIAEVVMVR